uniref:Protein kinase domain-containing protein n=1 Tax=Jaculus jaculus TaxID=51337 RepID=A0A8C5JXT0_JACJA
MEDYAVLRVIGEGSFGRALLVRQESSHRVFAMKEIRLPKVTMFHTFSLQILNWFTQMCLGVNHIHKKRVLHRDIKSKNVFLTSSGTLKLGDFGSARLLSNPMAFACTYVGTPYYVPPEIWENLPYNNKSDIWSLGCILYELCTLKHPFQANSWKNLILKICQGTVRPLPSHYSYELHFLVKQMFKRSPSQRPSATTLLSRGALSRLVHKCLPLETITEYGQQILDETKVREHNKPRKKDRGRKPGMVAHAFNPSIWEAEVGGLP